MTNTPDVVTGALVGNGPLRMFIALRILRAWNHGTEGFHALVVTTVNDWIDGGMKGPVPWPDSPFFAEWARGLGYSNVDGFVGFRFLAHIEDGGAR